MGEAETVPVYCGCWHRVGHHVWVPGMRRRPPDEGGSGGGAGPWKFLDSKKLNPGGEHGSAQLTHLDGWTALGITDNSVDERGGSHSTFAMEGTFDFAEALALAGRYFPEVVERIGSVRLVRTVDGTDA